MKFLDAFQDYDYEKLCEEFKDLLTKDDSSLEKISTKINHVLSKFRLDDLSFVLNIIYDACAPFIQQDSIANDDLDTYHKINLQDGFCLNEMNALENFEQIVWVEPIENNFTDKETSLSYKQLHIQSSTNVDIVEEDLIVNQGACLYSSNSFSNQLPNSITEGHIGDEYDLKCSNILIEPIRDIGIQFK